MTPLAFAVSHELFVSSPFFSHRRREHRWASNMGDSSSHRGQEPEGMGVFASKI